jgi:hypothetical protein
MHPSLNRTQLTLSLLASFIAALLFAACEMRLQIPSSTNAPDIEAYQFEATGEDFLISALDEVQAIADWSDSFQNGLSPRLSELTSAEKKAFLVVTSTDTIYIYGQTIPGGYGAVVTERYARPKGLLLITVRKTYGKGNGYIVTETKRYASYADHRNDNPQQTNVTEMYGTQTDTIVTHVLRNSTLQTYTFRLPVITRVVNPQDGSIRITSRYASNGEIVSKVTDGDGNLVQLRRSYGQSDGSTVTRTEYPDGSWRQVRTHGEADGKVTRESTSGLPSLGSGINTIPINNVPRPAMSLWRSHQDSGNLHGTSPDQSMRDISFLASGTMLPIGIPPRPRFTYGDLMTTEPIASGDISNPRPPLPSLASGATMINPKPPLPVAGWDALLRFGHFTGLGKLTDNFTNFASGIGTCPVPPRPAIPRETGPNLRQLASGSPCPPTNIPRPAIAYLASTNAPLLASGQSIPGPVPRPTFPGRYPGIFDADHAFTQLASGNSVSPPVVPRPILALKIFGKSEAEDWSTITRTFQRAGYLLASGITTCPKPPIPIYASSATMYAPKPPRPVVALFMLRSASARHRPAIVQATASSKFSLCSGLATTPPPPPRPVAA